MIKEIPFLRVVVLILATSIAGIALSCSFAFNFAVACGINSTEGARAVYEQNPSHSEVMYFDENELKYLYSAYPFGTAIMLAFMLSDQFQKMSLRLMIFVVTILSSILTFIIPFMYDWSPHSVLPLKILQGAVVAPTIPLIGRISSLWAPQNELGIFIAVLTCYSQIGLLFLMITSGPLCEQYNWRSLFYFNGIVSMSIGILWLIFYRDDPSSHPWMNEKEVQLIENGKSDIEKKRAPVPWKKLLKSKLVWACLIACVGNYNGVSPFVIFSNAIMKKGLHMTDMEASHFNSFSFAMQLLTKIISGKLTDNWKANESIKLRVFNTLSLGLCGCMAILTAFIPERNKYTCAVFLALMQGIIGFNAAGFNKAAVIVGRQHGHMMLTLYGFILTTSTILEPFLVDYIAPQSTWNQWFWLFIIHGSILIISNAIFCLWIQGRPASFTRTDNVDTKACESKLLEQN